MGTIDDYLATLDPADSAVISHTYDLALEVVREAEQGLGYGMPALVYRGSPLLSVMRAMPKSVILRTRLVSKIMFAGLMSRCTTPFWWACSTPSQTRRNSSMR